MNNSQIWPLVSIIIPTYNRKGQLYNCLESIKNIYYKNYEIIVVNNASLDNTNDMVKHFFSDVNLIELKENRGASGGRNAGIKYANGEWLCFIDDDNIVDTNFLTEMLELVKVVNNVGVIGPTMYFAKQKDKIWFSGAKIDLLTSRTTHYRDKIENNAKYRETEHIPNCFMVSRKVISKVGLIDETYHTYFEESDWHMRIRNKGYKCIISSEAKVYHDVPLKESNPFKRNARRGIYFAKCIARNRIIYMKKFSKKGNFILFIILFNNLYAFLFLINYLIHNETKSFKSYLKGFCSGLRYVWHSFSSSSFKDKNSI